MNFVIQDSTDNESFSNTGDHTPVLYPRSDADRDLSNNNKGAASVDAGHGVVDYEANMEEAETSSSSDNSNDADQSA